MGRGGEGRHLYPRLVHRAGKVNVVIGKNKSKKRQAGVSCRYTSYVRERFPPRLLSTGLENKSDG